VSLATPSARQAPRAASTKPVPDEPHHDHAQRGFDFWVMRDPWGNEFCVLHPNFPELLARRRPWTT